MSEDFSYDPVTAIDEASATGELAAIFADIRRTMAIPLVTSIWRGLAGMDNSLATVWRIAKPIYQSGIPEVALARLIERAGLPVAEPLVPPQLACVGIEPSELAPIRAIVDAYNRSNGMNLLALAALVAPESKVEATAVTGRTPPSWPELLPLQAQSAIADDTWAMVRNVNAFGAPGIDANVATLWRHLAHWPALLALVHAGFAPLQSDGSIASATERVVALAAEEGASMAHLRPDSVEMSEQARLTITGYVTKPTQVARMVTLGHALAHWLDPLN